MAAVETEMKKLTDIAVALARYDERILAMTTRWDKIHQRQCLRSMSIWNGSVAPGGYIQAIEKSVISTAGVRRLPS
jgi:hypothetical protein